MDAESTVRAYGGALGASDLPVPFFAREAGTVTFESGERLIGHGGIRLDRSERTVTPWRFLGMPVPVPGASG